ncbi:hypothetical protein PG993_012460 [Apiospora rasikravindrae]|uniref:Uncharacterized protein n=1 Tax=Apiospora rasikravindrae TaxID=990691 RepID=A0ABR1S4U6_9PEZI
MTRQTHAQLIEEDDPFADSDGDNASESSFDSLDLRHDRNELYRWGYSVHQAWLEVSTIQFKKFKLLLQDNVETAAVREKLRRDLETLASRARRKTQIDLIIDFLTPFVAHVRKSLEDEGIYSGTDKEIVAFKSVGFEGVAVEHNSIKNLFIVSEPEAAAEIVLRHHVEIKIAWLRKRLRGGSVALNSDDIRQIFLKCFLQIWALVEGQLEACKAKGHRADKVVLIGGFSASRSLRAYLKQSLAKYDGGRIQLITPMVNHGTTVSSGAVLRAFNKAHGPQRFARSSYGLLRHLPKDVYDAKHQKRNHEDANERTHPAPCTGEPYVRNTIEWFIKKLTEPNIAQNDIVPEDWARKPIRCQHFVKRCEDPELVIWEALYVSDTATESFYKKSHARNKDCEMIAYIRVDMSFLKQEGLLVPKPVPEGVEGDDYYEVEFDLVMKVHERDLQCFAKYGNRTLKECQINIASAFPAGVQ